MSTPNTFKVNGTLFPTQPTKHNWVPILLGDDDGNGRPLYSAVWEYQLSWQFASQATYNQLLAWWQLTSASGTVVVDLPKLNAASYGFYAYSGCLLTAPQFDEYFEQFGGNIVMTVKNVHPLSVAAS